MPKPVLLLVRHKLSGSELQRLMDGVYEKAFRNTFEVTVIEEDCDLDALCDRVRPDLIVFGGAHSALYRRTKVTNPRSHGGIPRVGLFLGDGFCTTRPVFFRDMDEWGVETYFAATFYMPEHTPEAAPRTFVLPHCFDEDLYRDYGESKAIPFSVFGEFAQWRPWRGETANLLMRQYPTLICPHPGYGAKPLTPMSLIGESYARTLNRSMFAICDGSMFNCVLRKHVEIPACGSILIAQPIDGLREYGFVDMENCVIGEGEALMTRIAGLVADPERMRAVAKAGFKLAHARHASRHCDQLHRWLLVRRELKPNQSIIQHGTFGAFEAVSDGRSGAQRVVPLQPNAVTDLMAEAEGDYRSGMYAVCAKKLAGVMALKTELAPPRLLWTRAALMAGRVQEAAKNAQFLYNFAKQADALAEPDPAELASWIMVKLCQGDVAGARAALAAFPAIRHRELRRADWLVRRLEGGSAPVPEETRRDDRPSVATSAPLTFPQWLAEAEAMLRNCGQARLADTVAATARA